MTDETEDLRGGLTFRTTTDPYRKKAAESDSGETASLKGGLTFSTTLHAYDGSADRRVARRDMDRKLYGEGLIGDALWTKKRQGNLNDRFMVSPFTVLSARDGWWQDRKRAWLALGIKSELGRGAADGTAAPGGSLMPSMDYSKGQRGDGAGRAIDGPVPQRAKPAMPAPKPRPTFTVSETLRPAPKLVTQQAPAAKVQPEAFKQPVQATRPSTGVSGFGMPKLNVAVAPSPGVRAPAMPATSGTMRALSMPESNWVAPTELPSLAGAKRIAVDVETRDEKLSELGPGFRRGDAYICGLAVGIDGGPRWYFPTRHEGGGNMDPEKVEAWAREELNKFDGEVVGNKLLYDLEALDTWGVSFPNVKFGNFHDIQLAEPLIDEWRHEYNMDAIAKQYGVPSKDERLLRQAAAAYGWKTDKDIKTNMWQMPAKYVGPYGEGDVDRPLLILPKQLDALEKDEQLHVYHLERRLIPVLLAMRLRGVRVDMQRFDEVRAGVVKQRDVLLAKLKRIAGSSAEFMAPATFEEALRDRGMVVPLTPKTSQPSITKAFFEKYKGDDLVETIASGRKLNTLINTFLDGHIASHTVKGRIHAEFIQLKNDDGGSLSRFSSANPNLQNLPARDEELGPLVRRLFVPEEGEQWERNDESQIEYRDLVHFAVGPGAEEARRRYNEDPSTDFHKFVAELCGIDPEDSIARKRVKGINFAKGYGAGEDKLAFLLKCSIEEARKFINLYDTSLPFAKATYDAAAKWARKRGFIVTAFGRKQRFPMWEPDRNYGENKKPALPREQAERVYGKNNIVRAWTYKALNRKLQGSAADLIKKAMVDAFEAGVCAKDALGAYLVTVHDELGTSVPRTERGEEASKELRYHMENALPLKVPCRVDTSRGASWGDCK